MFAPPPLPPSRHPRRIPPNPFLRPDLEAEGAICGAFFTCTYTDTTPSEYNLVTKAVAKLKASNGHRNTETIGTRVDAAMKALRQRGAIEFPKDIFRSCTLHGDSLHPELRAVLRLPHLPPDPNQPPPQPWNSGGSPKKPSPFKI